MRCVVVAFFLILLAAPASATADADIVSVDVAASTPGEQCATPNVMSGLCPIHYEDSGTHDVGDDEASTSLYVDEVAVTVRGPVTEAHHVRIDYEDVVIEHPVFHVVNGTWLQTNDTLPEDVKNVVTMESRPRRDRSGEYTDEWGIFLIYRSPAGDPTGLLWTERSVIQFCWSICEISPWEETDYTHVQPFPDGLALSLSSGTDYELTGWGPFVYGCLGSNKFQYACDELSAGKPYTDEAFETYMDLTPNYRIEMVQWNRTTGRIIPLASHDLTPESLQGANASATPAAPSGPSQRIARAPDLLLPRSFRPAANSPDASAPAASTPDVASFGAAKAVSVPPSTSSWSPITIIVAATSLLLTLTWWLLYSRINRTKALNHPTRQHIHDILEQEPGLKVGTLARRLGLDYHTVKHHVDTLHRLGLLRATGCAHKRYFTATTPPEAVQERSGPLSKPSTRRVLQHVRRLRRIEQRQLQQDLGLAASTVSEAVTRLREAGLIEDRRAGHVKIVTLPTTPLWDHATTRPHRAAASSTT